MLMKEFNKCNEIQKKYCELQVRFDKFLKLKKDNSDADNHNSSEKEKDDNSEEDGPIPFKRDSLGSPGLAIIRPSVVGLEKAGDLGASSCHPFAEE